MPKYRRKVARSRKKKPQGKKKVVTPNKEDLITTTAAEPTNDGVSTCSKKLKLDEEGIKKKPSTAATDDLAWCYILFDTRVLSDSINTIGSCPSCTEKIKFIHDVDAKKGLAHFLNLSCTKCDWSATFPSSKQVEKKKEESKSKGRPAFDVNTRSVIDMREVGRGFTALQIFCGFMNIPSQ